MLMPVSAEKELPLQSDNVDNFSSMPDDSAGIAEPKLRRPGKMKEEGELASTKELLTEEIALRTVAHRLILKKR